MSAWGGLPCSLSFTQLPRLKKRRRKSKKIAVIFRRFSACKDGFSQYSSGFLRSLLVRITGIFWHARRAFVSMISFICRRPRPSRRRLIQFKCGRKEELICNGLERGLDPAHPPTPFLFPGRRSTHRYTKTKLQNSIPSVVPHCASRISSPR